MADFDKLAELANSFGYHGASLVHGRRMDEAMSENDAGEEVYILCTNFLLYVALVLLTYLVCKLYLESNHSWDFLEGTDFKIAPTESYEVFPTIHEEGEDEEAPQKKEGDEETPDSLPEMKRVSSASLSEFLDYTKWDDNVVGSKKEVLSKLTICVLGLNISFIIWGVLQERMLTQTYQGEYFTYSYMLVFTNRLGGFVLSAMLMYFFKPPIETRAMIYEYSFPSVSNMLSSWCQYEALKYVTFPTQMLSKCFKLVPIMIMGKFMGNKTYPMYDYVVAGMIGLGITLFLTSTEGLQLGYDSIGEEESYGHTICGVMLLGFFLIFDSFTSQWQTRMFDRNKYLSPFQMMFAINAFSTIFSLITLLHTDELTPAWNFVIAHPQIHIHFVVFSICSTIGQLFIFYTIKNFGAVVFAIIMSTRILLSIMISCFMYNHPITEMGFLGMFIVFGAISYRIKRKTEGKRLVKWSGIKDSQGTDLFSAWHEHLDM
mmetsp:Transcript_29950/g.39375  ORF Transcript_29950/g.39375 Transcript_29950/m.39375 type:complete len:487 (+) Transcript_29950:58-1518(+)